MIIQSLNAQTTVTSTAGRPNRKIITIAQYFTNINTYDALNAYFTENSGSGEIVTNPYESPNFITSASERILPDCIFQMRWTLSPAGDTNPQQVTSSVDPITGETVINIAFAQTSVTWEERYGHTVNPQSVVTDITQDSAGRFHVAYSPFNILTE